MGTYTTNKNLFMPTVGEQGWGTLVNGNFEVIDNFLKPITVSGSTYTFTGSLVGNQSGGSISATSISNSGTLTQTGTSTFTGKITANGGIGTTALTTSSTITSTGLITGNGGVKGNLTGNVTGKINISSVGTNSNNVKVCKYSSHTITNNNISNGVNSWSLTSSQISKNANYNTSILNCTLTDTQLRTLANPTCTIKIQYLGYGGGYADSMSRTVTITNGSGTIVKTQKITMSQGGTGTVTFARNLNTNYTITTNMICGTSIIPITISTPECVLYVS